MVVCVVSCEVVQLLSTRLPSTKRLHDVADVDAITAEFLFSSGLATKFFPKPRTAANATAPGTATVRRDGDHQTRQTKHGTTDGDQSQPQPTTRHDRRQANEAQTTNEGSRQEHATTAPQTTQPTDHDDATRQGQHDTAQGTERQQTETKTATTATTPSQKTTAHEGQQPTQQTPPDRQTENTDAHTGSYPV